MTQAVRLISLTKGVGDCSDLDSQGLVAFTARVSNPANQMNTETNPKLLAYLIKHKHWSPLEMASMTVEIKTSRGIAAQILRHRSFVFQEFSQRYAEAQNRQIYEARSQDTKNRQNSIDNMSNEDKAWFEEAQFKVWETSMGLYKEAIGKGVAKEQARFLLPLGTETTMYMCGSLRSWVHYIDLRTSNGTQAEHKDIANAIKTIFCEQFPDIANALDWLSPQ